MGLIKAAVSAIGSGLADQWLEFLEADEMEKALFLPEQRRFAREKAPTRRAVRIM